MLLSGLQRRAKVGVSKTLRKIMKVLLLMEKEAKSYQKIGMSLGMISESLLTFYPKCSHIKKSINTQECML